MEPRSPRCRKMVSHTGLSKAWPLVIAIVVCFLAIPIQAQAGNNLRVVPTGAPFGPTNFAAVSDDGNYGSFIWFGNLYRCLVTGGGVQSVSNSPGTSGLVPYALAGATGHEEGPGVSMSKDGRYVAFTVLSGGKFHIYRRDMSAGTTLVCNDCQNPSISADGRYVAFESNSAALPDNPFPGVIYQIYRWDNLAAAGSKYKIISRKYGGPTKGGNGHSVDPAMSADGRYIAYSSVATNLIAADGNRVEDVFVYDYNTVNTKRLSGVTPAGVELPYSPTPGHLDAYPAFKPSISGNGQFVVYETQAALRPEDTNAEISDPPVNLSDIYIYDRWADKFTRVSMQGQGEEGQSKQGNGSHDPSISSDGGFIVFESNDECLADFVEFTDIKPCIVGSTQVFMRDRVAAKTYWISQAQDSTNSDPVAGNGDSTWPVVAKSGLVAGFSSVAANLDPNDPDGGVSSAFVFDRKYADILLNSLTKENRDPVTSGDGMTFTIVVKNTGPLSATGVKFSTLKITAETSTPQNPAIDTSFDIISGSSVFKNFSPTYCTKDYVPGSTVHLTKLNCSGSFTLDATVAPGQSVSRQISVRPYDADAGKITLDVAIENTKEKDPTLDNNWAAVYTRICAKGNSGCLASGPIDNLYPPP